MRALLFHNPSAGEEDHAGKMLLAMLHKAGLSTTYCSSKSSEFPDILHERADLFVAAGGDGTVGKILR
ncbi:MAG: hypothetical protein GEU91_02865 [Rhizobiales bacterium]|nr:hypothetical protein [Hyphomicrobiales bacterium]